MTKGTCLLIALIAFVIPLSAAAQGTPSRVYGAYVGGQGHYSRVDVDASVGGGSVLDDYGDGFGGSVYAGFGGANPNSPFYGALEVDIGYDNADWSEGGVEVDTEWTYGASFILGGVISDRYLVYGRAGWQRTHAEASGVLGSRSEGFNGFRFGGGFEAFLTDDWRARAEYTYTIYEEKDVGVFNIDPSQHLVRIGIAYHF